MKKNIVILFLLLNSLQSTFAQEACSDEMIMAKKGKWTKGSDVNMTGQTAPISSRLDKMQQLLQAAYPEPKGIEAGWHCSMGGYYPAINKNSVAYNLDAMFHTWYCNIHLKKLLLGTEASNTFNIWANKFGWFANKDENFLINSQPVYLLSKKLGELNGFLLFAGDENVYRNTGTTYSKTILISRPGQLPYIPVSQKQFLSTYLKKKSESHKIFIESIRKMKVRTDVEEEVYKNQQLEKEINKPGNELAKEKAKSNFLRGYSTEKQRQQKDLDKIEEVYQRDIKAANFYLNNTSGDELEKPAYVHINSYQNSFSAFEKENEGSIMVQVNENYFNSKLPAYAPQFLVVYWIWNTEKPSTDFANHIEKNFDFKALQVMLDK